MRAHRSRRAALAEAAVALLVLPVTGAGLTATATAGEPSVGVQDPGYTWLSETSPPPRVWHAMAYDAARGQVVVFGGAPIQGGPGLGDTWVFEGDDWSLASPKVSPPPRWGHAMAYDSQRQRIVVFGGCCTSEGRPFGDTWEWDGSTWTLRPPIVDGQPGASPPARGLHAMAYDSANRRIVVFGGSRDPVPRFPAPSDDLGDTWTWDGVRWKDVTLPLGPSPRSASAMAYDANRGEAVLFGGTSGSNETWRWDGTTWQMVQTERLHVLFGGGHAKACHAMTFDSRRNRIVLFGGGCYFPGNGLADTWEWNGTTWVRVADSGPHPRWGHAIAYNARIDRTVLLGGCCYGKTPLGDTGLWDGVAWSVRAEAGTVEARRLHATAYDSDRGRLVLFGGLGTSGELDDTWEWDGETWTRLKPQPSPPPRYGHAMAYDPIRKRVVLFGGDSSSFDTLEETWEWDGEQWTERHPSNQPPGRDGHALAYDEARRRIVLFGGLGPTGCPGGKCEFLDDTWVWDGEDWTEARPATRPPGRSRHAIAYDDARQR
ncbi:MAG: kelch repeat-containing protein, partial [Actinomycetota bacterium]|nr:kelch repeat-containing protein [Actinomycetota bacterium]